MGLKRREMGIRRKPGSKSSGQDSQARYVPGWLIRMWVPLRGPRRVHWGLGWGLVLPGLAVSRLCCVVYIVAFYRLLVWRIWKLELSQFVYPSPIIMLNLTLLKI